MQSLEEGQATSIQNPDSPRAVLPKVQSGLSRKLTHLWHDPFRIDEVHEDFRVKIKVEAVSTLGRLKPRVLFPKRPTVVIDVDDDDDFDAALFPEDSWKPDAGNDEYEAERILDLRRSKRTRTTKRNREYLVKWKGCGAVLYEFNQGARVRARFQAMQVGD
ncbi:hypothetical protein P3T76_005150 [Phytophthora citrophthora]|uniref:Chromo domain-containing protein n=1 Tax=Phytophthora citrophthora TaxID=4793 RepID=A0AAD9GRL9_9STRA|nr:hypothetical protein P3T76_005150 [Phytophthora citrophthora]